jgi:hypothetical protein
LPYEIAQVENSINATGNKPHYYSQNRFAADFGYAPALTSLDGVMQEATTMLQPPTTKADCR